MKHHKAIRKFSRERKVRTALMRSLARNLIIAEKMRTTEAKAKELRPFIEKLITASKSGTLASRRLVTARLGNVEKVSGKLFTEIAPRFKDRAGGYTRIVKLGKQGADARKMAQIEFVESK
jgi:large subunit ribosomal protein L17